MFKSLSIRNHKAVKNLIPIVTKNQIKNFNKALFSSPDKAKQIDLISRSLAVQHANATKVIPILDNLYPEPIWDYNEGQLSEILLRDDSDGKEIPTCKPTPSCRVKKPKKKNYSDKIPKKDPCKKSKPCGKGIKNTCNFEDDPKWDK